jgi:AcrR family transcriptional regulator
MPIKGRAPSEGAAPKGLTPARNGFGRERVVEIQRARILAAMTEVCIERGAGGVTVARLVERAGVSRRTFYEVFEDREECFLAAFDEGVARASGYVLDVYDPEAGWAERLRMALTALLEFLDVERGAGWLLVVGSLGAGTAALERRRRVLAQMITVVDEGRREAKAGQEPPPLTAEGVVGGVLSILHARLAGEDDRALVDLAGPLMGMIVLPYLGGAAARRELARPIPKRHAVGRRTNGDPLRDLGLRLTYRTVCVLVSVAGRPGCSNREIGGLAGISDQGQVSKLLSRLERLGLIENAGLAPGKGAPNAWALTEKGAQVARAMSAQMSGREQP